MIEDGTVEYRLIKPFEYKSNGGTAVAEFCELLEPGYEHAKYYLKLKQMVVKAELEVAQMATSMGFASEEDMAGERVKPFHEQTEEFENQSEEMEALLLVALQMSEKVDVSEFVATFAEMCTSGKRKSLCLVGGQEKITDFLFAQMHPEDAFAMAVKWCSFFVTALAAPAPSGSRQQPKSVTAKVV